MQAGVPWTSYSSRAYSKTSGDTDDIQKELDEAGRPQSGQGARRAQGPGQAGQIEARPAQIGRAVQHADSSRHRLTNDTGLTAGGSEGWNRRALSTPG